MGGVIVMSWETHNSDLCLWGYAEKNTWDIFTTCKNPCVTKYGMISSHSGPGASPGILNSDTKLHITMINWIDYSEKPGNIGFEWE